MLITGAVDFLGLGPLICFDALSHIPCVFSKGNELYTYTYYKNCLLIKIKIYACYTVEIYKNKPLPWIRIYLSSKSSDCKWKI